MPPYTELLSWADSKLNIALNFANYLQLTDDPLYIDAYLQSLRVAAVSTLCCLIIGYPLAWRWPTARRQPATFCCCW